MAWTALVYAIFYRKGRRPWLRKPSTGTGVRYLKVDAEPMHWELMESLKQYFGDKQSPKCKNLEFLVGLRNKIEHMHLPYLCPALYGESRAGFTWGSESGDD